VRQTATGIAASEATQSDRLGFMTLVLKRASASSLSGEWSDDDYDVLAESIVVGRIMKAAAAAPLASGEA
jgi:hypothetical protein